MSDLVLIVGLVGTFCAVIAAGLAVDSVFAGRRRAVELLQSEVSTTGISSNLREQDLTRSFVERGVFPVASRMRNLARRLTPVEVRRKLARKLVLAGSPRGWDADRVAAMKVIGLFAGGLIGVVCVVAGSISGLPVIGILLLFCGLGFFAPDGVLAGRADARQSAVGRALPDTMDLLTISVEAGLGFDAALAHVIHRVPGPLSEEISRMLQEVQLGVSRADAFRHLAERTDVDELRGFVLSMVQADIFGISVARVLRAQAKDLRVKRRQNAERRAMQVPVKILFPLIFCVMPALFVVTIGPGAIRAYQSFIG